jgi:hypothetical protein
MKEKKARQRDEELKSNHDPPKRFGAQAKPPEKLLIHDHVNAVHRGKKTEPEEKRVDSTAKHLKSSGEESQGGDGGAD